MPLSVSEDTSTNLSAQEGLLSTDKNMQQKYIK